MPNVFGGSGKKEQRDSACTPKWIAELIGRVRLDPATNPRSNIDSEFRCMLEDGGNGLEREGRDPGRFKPGGQHVLFKAMPSWDVFINCGYNRGEVERWIAHYGHTRFIFLLKWSPDTEWFAKLFPLCDYVWFPLVRVDFDPPPGVEFSSNPLPHALYLRKPSDELLSRLRGAGWLLRVTPELLDWVSKNWQTWKHEHRQARGSVRQGPQSKGGARGGAKRVRSSRRGDAPSKRGETGKATCYWCGDSKGGERCRCF